MWWIALLVIWFVPGVSLAAPDCNDPNAVSVHDDAPSTSISFAYTLRSGSNQVMFIAIQGRSSDPTISNVQYAGVAVDAQIDTKLSDVMWSGFYRLANPSAGTNNVTATLSATPTRGEYIVFVCNDVDVSSPIRSSAEANGFSTTPSSAPATVDSTDTVIDVFVTDSTTITSQGADQTIITSGASGSSASGASFQAGTVSPATMSWTTGTDRWVSHSAAVKAAPVAAEIPGDPLWFQ